MAIDVTRPWSGLKANRGDPRTAEMAWDVWFNGADHPGDPTTAINSSGVAQNQTASLNEAGSTMLLYCQSISAAPTGFGVYRVTAYYATTPKGHFFNPAFPTSPPEPIEYLFEPASTSEPVDRDCYGNPIANTNLDVFQSLPSKFFSLLNLTIRWYSISFDIAYLTSHQNTVNSTAWSFGPFGAWSVAAGEAFCKGIRSMTEVTVKSPYVRLEGQWELKPPVSGTDSDMITDSFKYRVLNAGRRCFVTDTDGTRLVDIIYQGGATEPIRVQDDVRLDGSGIPIDLVSYAANGTGSTTPVANSVAGVSLDSRICVETIGSGVNTAVFLHYQMYPLVDYSGLHL